MFAILLCVLCATVIIAVYLWDRKLVECFKSNNIPYLRSSLLGGSLKEVLLLQKPVAHIMLDLYQKANERNVPMLGVRFLYKNSVVLSDLDLIKQVLLRDFNNFPNRSVAADHNHDPFGAFNLFIVKNPMWHDLRKRVSPVFTGSRMRKLFQDINAMGERLHNQLITANPTEFDMNLKYLSGAYTIDVYASCSFGVDVNFVQTPDSEFGQLALKMFDFKVSRALEFGANFMAPEISQLFRGYFFSRSGSLYLKELLTHVLQSRESGEIYRNDLMDLILDIKKQQKHSDNLSDPHYDDEQLLAQNVIFFVAGYETTSTALTHTFYELAKNPHIQRKLKEEYRKHIDTHGQLTYENLAELKYASMVFQEVFRMYPAFSFLTRECVPENGQSHYRTDNGSTIPKGTPVYVPTYALHRDERYFPNANTFDPERFSAENCGSIPKGAYLPFGDGPRQCIAERLSYMVMKIALFNVLRRHTLERCPKTPADVRPRNLAVLVVPHESIYIRLRQNSGGDFAFD